MIILGAECGNKRRGLFFIADDLVLSRFFTIFAL